MRLFVFGRGYSASHFLTLHAGGYTDIAATTRGQRPLQPIDGVRDIVFDGMTLTAEAEAALAAAEIVLVSIPPNPDDILAHVGDTLRRSRNLQRVVYLSTIGVYGDHEGRWVDEETVPVPTSPRSRRRLDAERAWLGLGEARAIPVHILRLAGIYGPGQNALVNLQRGTARRLIKPGQVFNRIHVVDIAAAIQAAISYPSGGIWNVADDEPAPPQDVIAFAADLLGVPAPPEEKFGTATLTPMARSFYSENKRVANARLRNGLGVDLTYPTYRQGIAALYRSLGE